MNAEAIIVVALLAIGGYRIYEVRHNSLELAAWTTGISAAVCPPLSQLIPALRLPLLVLGAVLLLASVVLFVVHHKPDSNVGDPRS